MVYGSVEEWRVYATARGNAAPAEASDPVASAALQRASDYVYYHYEKKAFTAIPEELLNAAAYEVANVELSSPGFFRKAYTPAEVKVLTEVDGIKWTVIGEVTDAASMMPTLGIVESMLEDYIGRAKGVGIMAIG